MIFFVCLLLTVNTYYITLLVLTTKKLQAILLKEKYEKIYEKIYKKS